ncbi:endoplasmic reticulum metallopeptidase 1 isoform X2 [Anthonomus grandis grandis]|uniref:endoplasmic reticulum metallopeptidase 1 isoform X2 n=1 Tax=Anthonomus grandis grandis TaxID=2921223 RepID=UPI0021667BFF|nr:endoplasmic reticulum metallopeptidase 1 isoform X2 [Anthonomus grandis grandis]
MPRRYNYNYTSPFNMDNMDRSKDSIHSIPFWVGFLVLIGLGGLFGVVYLVDGILPTALNTSDETNYPDSFIAERAINDLLSLTSIGQRITGSYENEYLTVEFLLLRINSIISEANSQQYIELDLQTVTGGYYLNDAVGYMNVYDKVQNVVVKLHGKNNDTNHSIFLNCHFDAVPVSPGGSDDGINVVIMLEVLRKLSQRDSRLSQNVIFLFNGAEETPMQASHGYIAHHKWANESKVLVNLEASGAGGRLQLFQTGPKKPWLVKYYSQVPHPFGSVTAEELFQSGLLPSDTDFRVFRDFGEVVGVDMAYTSDGYRYHTKYDGFDNIPSGSYQHGGDNVLSLVKSLADAPEMTENMTSTEASVYFDVLGWFFIHYTNTTAMIVNYVVMALSLAVFVFSLLDFRTGTSKSTAKFIIFTLLAIVFSWIIASTFVIALAFLLDVLNKTMSWYGHLWFAFGLYMVPIVGLSGCLMAATNHKNLSLGVRSQLQGHLLRLIWTLILLVGTLLGVRSSYAIMILVLFNSLAFVIIHLCRIQHTVRTWQVVYVAAHIIPCTYTFYMMWGSLVALTPMTGRSGADANPEIYIAVIFLFFILLATSALTVVSNLLRHAIWYYLALLAVFLVIFGLLFTPIGFPYVGNDEAPRPQRHWIMHTQRQFFDESFAQTDSDSGILMVNMDRNSPRAIKPYVADINNAISLASTGICDKYTFCALPMTHSKVLQKIGYSTWIPVGAPSFPSNETLGLTIVSKEKVSSTLLKYTLKVTGPDKLVFYITPKTNVTFINTSLITVVKPTIFTFQGRPVYVVLYQLGKGDGTPLTFNLTVLLPEGYSGPTMDIGLSGRYVHQNRIEKTEKYLEFLKNFPNWAHPIAWLASYHSYVI